ncbi:hypothetical protein [Belnapia sp. F-4-1]|uniref:hypothetical protein n=1 Tax=Belnapia sp. F-4-1 TaxID=1545443 RepID=UPI0005BB6365|nr:hypothetical protein [Belnapia sp. F-4-1]
MRLFSLLLLGLGLIAVPAEAAQKSGGGRQQAQATVTKPQQAGRSQLGRPQSAVHRSVPMRGRGSAGRDQRAASAAACSAKHGGCRAPRMSWAQGLPPAAGIQANACPDGTMAVLATGHDDIVRCMPI